MPEGPDENGKIWIDRVYDRIKSKIKKNRHEDMIIHKCGIKSTPTIEQPATVRYYYICNPTIEAIRLKTDITSKKVTCKKCKKIMQKWKSKTKSSKRGDKMNKPGSAMSPYERVKKAREYQRKKRKVKL